MLGYEASDTSSGLSHTASNALRVPVSGVVVDVKESMNRVYSSNVNGSQRGSAVILLDSTYGLYQNMTEPCQTLEIHFPTKKLNVKLYDLYGQAVSLNGSDWILILEK